MKYEADVYDRLVEKMFEEMGHTRVEVGGRPDFLVFCGGGDVNPFMYHEVPEPQTCVDPDHDEASLSLLSEYPNLPAVGICRGAQFLHVMAGYKLRQHVEGHGLADTHPVRCEYTGELAMVTSTHHQQMLSTPYYGNPPQFITLMTDRGSAHPRREGGLEAVVHRKKRYLCFQPHPEYKSDLGYTKSEETRLKFIQYFNLLMED
jgi:gamma-glutamyl-gamma-aminobutyrate hydrolase PuuD